MDTACGFAQRGRGRRTLGSRERGGAAARRALLPAAALGVLLELLRPRLQLREPPAEPLLRRRRGHVLAALAAPAATAAIPGRRRRRRVDDNDAGLLLLFLLLDVVADPLAL